MPDIHVLAPGLVNQIAAGEVVERPASVVKELVENALDAGARSIQIEVQEGGLSLIRVADDGSGMTRENALLSIERHATSKLRDAAGLTAIATMGFRGEALPAIASVSRLRIDTCVLGTTGSDGGTRIAIAGGEQLDVSIVARAPGTTVEVRDLFFNTPARRKFMRAASTESGHISEAVVRLALARRDVGFLLRSNGRISVSTPPGATLEERVAVALDRDALSHLQQVDGGKGAVRVRGLACSPDFSQATQRGFYLFINGRYVRDRGAAHAVSRAYAETLPSGRHPVAALFLEMPLDAVDVNVHPQKLEVRFADARGVYDAIVYALSDTLRTAPWLRHRPATADLQVPSQRAPLGSTFADTASVLAYARDRHSNTELKFPLPRAGEPHIGEDPGVRPTEAGFFASLRYIGQHAKTYLVCEAPSGALVLIDQHASHERVLFHRLREAFRARSLAVQPFLIPQTVTLPHDSARTLEAHPAELARLGFDVEPFGGEAIAIKGAPALLAGVDFARLLKDLAAELEQNTHALAGDVAFHDLLATMACHSAVRAHDEITADEVRALLDDLDGVDFKARCPHGRPVVCELGLAELERRVGRR